MKGNIFQEARRSSGKTQKQASDELYIGMRTLQHWEEGKINPTGETVARLAKYYKCPWLNYLWMQETTEPGREELPRIAPMDLCQSVLYMQKELADVQRQIGKLIEIASDGMVGVDEMDQFDLICREAKEAAGALLTLALCGRTIGGGAS